MSGMDDYPWTKEMITIPPSPGACGMRVDSFYSSSVEWLLIPTLMVEKLPYEHCCLTISLRFLKWGIGIYFYKSKFGYMR